MTIKTLADFQVEFRAQLTPSPENPLHASNCYPVKCVSRTRALLAEALAFMAYERHMAPGSSFKRGPGCKLYDDVLQRSRKLEKQLKRTAN